MKLAIVVQRYAEDIGGGSELHARYIAEHLAAFADVRVLTTCARDYISWKNEYPPGVCDDTTSSLCGRSHFRSRFERRVQTLHIPS